VTTYAERLTNISLVIAEIFCRICRFLLPRPKRCSCYPRNFRSYWTDLDHICTCHAAITFPLYIFELKLPYSLPFRYTSLANKGHFANFAQNWLPWQRPLRNWKKRSTSIIYEQVPFIRCKDCENRSSGS